jgi:UDP-N-acetyl-D-mannosaminuronic acid dehydrogenase
VLRPGPGVGGHCISVDPWFLVEAAPEETTLVRAARQVNDSQPARVVARIGQTLGGLPGKTVAVLGLAYKADVDDLRESPALEVAARLAASGADVRTFEPHAPATTVPGGVAAPSLEVALDQADAAVLLVDHRAFAALSPAMAAKKMRGRYIFDGRGALRRAEWEAAGFRVDVLGVGASPPTGEVRPGG